MQNVGIIICSRVDSKRLPNKAFKKIAGKEAHRILLDRIYNLPYMIVMAIPSEQKEHYRKLEKDYTRLKWYYGHADNPMGRMLAAAKYYNLGYIVRITIDDILIHAPTVIDQVENHIKKRLDYSYCSKIIEGAGVEVIKYEALERAYQKNNVEHISYFLRTKENKIEEYIPQRHLCRSYRLTLDYPEDKKLMDIVLRSLGSDASIERIIRFLDKRKTLLNINKLPEVTVYTCFHNAQEYLHNCIRSVLHQKTTFPIEYILCDDFSQDDSVIVASEYLSDYRIKILLNDTNMGLASSSNRCLERARGRYIIRLDADDFFVPNNSLQILYDYLQDNQDTAIVYPGFYHGKIEEIRDPRRYNHPAGAMIKTKCLNEIKFKNNLRHLDGYDLFLNMKKYFKIGYINKPLFFYTQREKSLSHSNLKSRSEIKRAIELEHLQ